MAVLNGKDVILKFKAAADAGTPSLLLVCETENGFEATTEITSTSTKCDGGATYTGLGAKTWTMSGAGVVKTDPTVSEVSYGELLAWWQNGTLLTVLLADPGAVGFTHTGDVYITSLSLSNPQDGNSTFSLTLTGNGAVTIV